MMKKILKAECGFTLVELAIVLMIIGLLVGGVLRGQELIMNSRVTGTIQQVKAYQGAKHTFVDAYNALPGDIPNALTRLVGCTAANRCGNGNGDGHVGYFGLGSQSGTLALPNVETSYFWKHMALAHLISGVDPSADPLAPVWGKTHPAAKIGGGFVIFYSDSATPGAAGDYGIGHTLILLNDPTKINAAAATERGKMAISPKHAFQIDKKMDDGLSDSGEVAADYVVTGCETGANGNEYATTEEKNCLLYFNID